ncbi:DUF6571 family protein [Actinomyces wuliandei]|uniref:DUF6571 family protein n=1 Tax=Actinomyces wuliandei TaxID=2057743 RepID=UPI0015D62E09|nr:DUF6571 family protein [Actinomyces wuliandei]
MARAGWVVRRGGLVVVVLVVVLAGGGVGAGGWWWVRVHDPLAGVLEGLVGDPVAALDYLAPEGPAQEATTAASAATGGASVGADGEAGAAGGGGVRDGVWVASGAAVERWGGLSSRGWGSEGLEALAGVGAVVSSLRADGDPVVRARALWVSGRVMGLFGGVPVGRFSGEVRRQVAVVVANCAPEVVGVALGRGSGGGLGLGGGLPERQGVVASVVYRLVEDGDAVVTVASGLASVAARGQVSTAGGLEGVYYRVGAVQAFLGAVGSVRGAELEAGGAGEEEMEGFWGVQHLGRAVFTTVVGGRGGGAGAEVAAPLVVQEGATLGGPVAVGGLPGATVADLEGPTAGSRSLLEAYAYAEAANSGLVPQEALTRDKFTDVRGEPYSSWYREPGSGDGPVVDLPAAPSDDVVSEVRGWAGSNSVANLDEDHVLMDAANAINKGGNAATELVLGADGEPGGDPGDITINKD